MSNVYAPYALYNEVRSILVKLKDGSFMFYSGFTSIRICTCCIFQNPASLLPFSAMNLTYANMHQGGNYITQLNQVSITDFCC